MFPSPTKVSHNLFLSIFSFQSLLIFPLFLLLIISLPNPATSENMNISKISFYKDLTNEANFIPITFSSSTFQSLYHLTQNNFRIFYYDEAQENKLDGKFFENQLTVNYTNSTVKFKLNETDYLFGCTEKQLFIHFRNSQTPTEYKTEVPYYLNYLTGDFEYNDSEHVLNILKCDIDYYSSINQGGKLVVTIPYYYTKNETNNKEDVNKTDSDIDEIDDKDDSDESIEKTFNVIIYQISYNYNDDNKRSEIVKKSFFKDLNFNFIYQGKPLLYNYKWHLISCVIATYIQNSELFNIFSPTIFCGFSSFQEITDSSETDRDLEETEKTNKIEYSIEFKYFGTNSEGIEDFLPLQKITTDYPIFPKIFSLGQNNQYFSIFCDILYNNLQGWQNYKIFTGGDKNFQLVYQGGIFIENYNWYSYSIEYIKDEIYSISQEKSSGKGQYLFFNYGDNQIKSFSIDNDYDSQKFNHNFFYSVMLPIKDDLSENIITFQNKTGTAYNLISIEPNSISYSDVNRCHNLVSYFLVEENINGKIKFSSLVGKKENFSPEKNDTDFLYKIAIITGNTNEVDYLQKTWTFNKNGYLIYNGENQVANNTRINFFTYIFESEIFYPSTSDEQICYFIIRFYTESYKINSDKTISLCKLKADGTNNCGFNTNYHLVKLYGKEDNAQMAYFIQGIFNYFPYTKNNITNVYEYDSKICNNNNPIKLTISNWTQADINLKDYISDSHKSLSDVLKFKFTKIDEYSLEHLEIKKNVNDSEDYLDLVNENQLTDGISFILKKDSTLQQEQEILNFQIYIYQPENYENQFGCFIDINLIPCEYSCSKCHLINDYNDFDEYDFETECEECVLPYGVKGGKCKVICGLFDGNCEECNLTDKFICNKCIPPYKNEEYVCLPNCSFFYVPNENQSECYFYNEKKISSYNLNYNYSIFNKTYENNKDVSKKSFTFYRNK